MDRKTGLYIGIGFLTGILLTLGFKDVYPDLERRYKQRRRRLSAAKKRKSIAWSTPSTQKVTLEKSPLKSHPRATLINHDRG